MAKTKEQKQIIIEDLTDKMKQQKSAALIDFSGIDSVSLFALRDELKEADCQLQVIKKTLVQKVLEKIGQQDLADKIKEISGQLALVFGFSDEVAPARICHQFAKKQDKLKLKAGILDGDLLSQEQIIALAELPSKQELLARLVGSLKAPVSNFVYVLNGNIKGLVYALNAIKENK